MHRVYIDIDLRHTLCVLIISIYSTPSSPVHIILHNGLVRFYDKSFTLQANSNSLELMGMIFATRKIFNIIYSDSDPILPKSTEFIYTNITTLEKHTLKRNFDHLRVKIERPIN